MYIQALRIAHACKCIFGPSLSSHCLASRSAMAAKSKTNTKVNKAAKAGSKAADAKTSKTKVNLAATAGSKAAMAKSKSSSSMKVLGQKKSPRVIQWRSHEAFEKMARRELAVESRGIVNVFVGGEVIMHLTERHYDRKSHWF